MPLGWDIFVSRQNDAGLSPAAADSPEGPLLAKWEAGLGGLDWLDELVREGKAIDLGGDGYPFRYTAPAKFLFPRIAVMPPGAKSDWEGWKVVWSEAPLVEQCRPEEWLIVEAWDQS
jgi:hypothetical protein